MKINNKFKKVYITIFMLFILYTDNAIALTGSEIIKRANQYLTLRWQCNPWNAYEVRDSKGNILKSNRDPDPNNDINEYPFYPQGACYLDENNIPRISNGLYIGMAYAWGLRESPEVFIEKLRKINYNGTGYIAGNHVKTYKKKSEENLRWRLWYYYTGIDCSGLVWNSMGFPKLSRPSSPYSLCRFSTTNIMDQSGIFSDEIEWNSLKKGDILIKSGHVAIVCSSPIGNRVNVIEAVVKRGKFGEVYRPQVIGNYYEKMGDTIFRGEQINSIGYQPRRFSPPYLKRLALYVPFMKGGKINSFIKVYEREWRNKTDGSWREIVDIIPPKVVRTDELYVEAEFTKAMAVHTNYGISWEDTKIKIGKTYKTSYAFSPVNTEKKVIINKFNSGKKIKRGWANGYNIDNGIVFTKWIGKIKIKYFKPGEYNIYIYAKSLTQDELDSEPATKAERTEQGGWINYEAGVDTNHKFTIGLYHK